MGSITSTEAKTGAVQEEGQGPVEGVTEQVANAGKNVSSAIGEVFQKVTGAINVPTASPAPTSGGRRRVKKKNAIKSAKKSRKNKTKTKKSKSRSNK